MSGSLSNQNWHESESMSALNKWGLLNDKMVKTLIAAYKC